MKKLTLIDQFNTSINYYGKIKPEGERSKKDLYRLMITDLKFPCVKIYGTRLFDLQTISRNRIEFLNNNNVREIGFHYLSTSIKKSDNQFIVKANVQGEEFESEPCALELATMIYDTLISGDKK